MDAAHDRTRRSKPASRRLKRTTSLQQALQAGELHETRLALTLEDLRASQEAFRELSAAGFSSADDAPSQN